MVPMLAVEVSKTELDMHSHPIQKQTSIDFAHSFEKIELSQWTGLKLLDLLW